jgi:ethanolamine utilization protein EutP (predicted NTPase)
MKLQDRISEIGALDFCKKVINVEDVSNPEDVEKFGFCVKHVNYFDVSGSVMPVTKAPVYVLNEGTDDEEAYFKDNYPPSRVRANTVVSEVEEAEDGSISEVKKLITSTGEKKIVEEVVLKEAPVKEVIEEPIKQVSVKG